MILIQKLSDYYQAHFKLILVLVLSALILTAWSNRFIQDDAFISFRYADNLVHGKGLVWNDGERVEGYSNFLWTVLIGLALFLKLDPVRSSWVVGLILFAISLYLTYRVAAGLFHSRNLALLTLLLLGTNHTFSSYATGGMETQLQACLFVACVFLMIEADAGSELKALRLCLLSFLLGLAVLTRPDSVLLVAVLLPLALIEIYRQGNLVRRPLLAASLSAPLTVLIIGWLFWKLRFYGAVIPNTFYVKVNSLNSLKRGVIYVYLFLHSYWLILFPFLFLVFGRRLWQAKRSLWLALALLVAVWLAYVVAIGGDFMEFRFIVPVMPFIFLLLVWLIVQVRKLRLQIVLILLVLAGSLHHALTFTNPSLRYYDIESTQGLANLLTQPRTDWVGTGKVLGDSFAQNSNVSIATTAAGAIPYYSHLPAVDVLGLNDQWVAHYGEIVTSKPGHQRRATLDYLMQRKVNLLIGHPQLVSLAADFSDQTWNDFYFYVRITPQDALPKNARIIEIPVNSSYKLRVLYLTQNALVDETINRKGWKTFPYVRAVL